MFKKIFKAAKDLIRSPVGQIGLGILVPGLAGSSNALLSGIGAFAKTNPALFQAGLGLASGAKPEDVLRNVAFSAGTSALRGGMSGQGGVSEFFGMGQPAQNIGGALNVKPDVNMDGGYLGENFINKAPVRSSIMEEVKKPGVLESLGLVNTGEGLNFFEKYAPLVKLGGIGFSVAAAALGEEQAKALYDPNKNPYLTGDTKITDVYTPMNQGGGVMDFPEKDGMINGPGDGQSDDIPAMLSDGEFVMTKQAVMAAGDGDREKGTKKMYDMMYSLQDKAENMGIGKF